MKTGRRIPKWVALLAGILAVLAVTSYSNYRYKFPYGSSHCCDLLLYGALEEYASAHEGAFPAGQASPAASLSLLYTNVSGVTPYLLRGKTVPESTVKARLSRGELLTPESCGWHYVDGLRVDDDPRLALFWDKAGLGHNGQRLPNSAHVVMLLGQDRKNVSGREWAKFLEEQNKLLAARTNGTEIIVSATTQINGEAIRVQLRVMEDSLFGQVWRDGWFSTGGTLANIDREPETGLVGIPVIAKEKVRTARVETDKHTGQVRFFLGTNQLLFDGSKLRFIKR